MAEKVGTAMKSIALRPWELAAYMREKKLLVVRPYKPSNGYPVIDGEITPNPNEGGCGYDYGPCPFGKPGEVLGIKEAFGDRAWYTEIGALRKDRYYYAADGKKSGWTYRPASQMPIEAIRHRPTISDIRVIEIADMRPADVVAAGFPFGSDGDLFKAMWNKHYPTLSWGWGIFLEGT